jgi:hypothetical protein
MRFVSIRSIRLIRERNCWLLTFRRTFAASTRKQTRKRSQHALIPLTQQRRQNVLTDALAPQVIATVAARVRSRIEVDPVVVRPTRNTVSAVADPFSAKPEAPFQAIEVDAARGIEIDHHIRCHALLPIHAVNTQILNCYTLTTARCSLQCAATDITIPPVGCGMSPAGSSVTASILS